MISRLRVTSGCSFFAPRIFRKSTEKNVTKIVIKNMIKPYSWLASEDISDPSVITPNQ